MDVHRAEPPLQTGAEVVVAAAAAAMEQRGRLPLGGRQPHQRAAQSYPFPAPGRPR